MRSKFRDLIAAGVASQKREPVAPQYVNQDPLVRFYNNYWGSATGSHMSKTESGYLITGSIFTAPPGSHFNRRLDNMMYGCIVAGVELKNSGYQNFVDFLYKNNLETSMTVINGANAMELRPRIDMPCTGCASCTGCDSAIPVPMSTCESVNGTIMNLIKHSETVSQLCEAMTDSPYVRGEWVANKNVITNGKYIITLS